MSDLSDFLLARIAEDEAVAERFISGWGDALPTGISRDELAADFGTYPSTEHTEIGLGLGRFLAECEAKRRIVERYVKIQGRTQDGDLDERLTLGWVLEQMAAPYADHPDYREEWRL